MAYIMIMLFVILTVMIGVSTATVPMQSANAASSNDGSNSCSQHDTSDTSKRCSKNDTPMLLPFP